MSSARTAKKTTEAQLGQRVRGGYLGTDGAGYEHYYQMGSRIVTMTDGDETREFKIPTSSERYESPLLSWAFHVIVQHDGALWEELRIDDVRADVMEGKVEDEEFDQLVEEALENTEDDDE